MKVLMAVVCERAVAREGFLNVLGAGVNTLTRDPLPAPLDVDFAITLLPESEDEARQETTISVAVVLPNGSDTEIARIDGAIKPDFGDELPSPMPQMIAAFPFRFVAVEAYGPYDFVFTLHGEEIARVPVEVKPPRGGAMSGDTA